VSPKSYNTTATNEKKGRPAIHNNNSNSNSNNTNNHNVTVVTTLTKVKDPKMDAAASAERRQDRSPPIPLKSQTPGPSQYSSSSSLPPSLSAPTRDHWRQHQQQQLRQKGHDEEQFKRENVALQKECEELELIILQMKMEGNIFHTRTGMGLGNYRTEIEKATEEKDQLQDQCKDLEDQIWSLRNETRLKQESIWATEEKLRLQKKRQPRRFGRQTAASAMANK
jgi:hypothetical protein